MKNNASMFRTFARLEEAMIRAAMPRTSAADPTPLPTFGNDGTPRTGRTWSNGKLVTAKSGFKLAEVLR